MDIAEIQIISSTERPLVVGNSQYRSITDFQLIAEDLEKAYQKLNEREDAKRDCFRKLRQRLEGDEFTSYRTDDRYLLRYLRFAKYNCDRAYTSMRKLYTMRLKHPELFCLTSNLEIFLKCGFFTFLPYMDQEGRFISIMDFRKWNIEEMTSREALTAMTAIFDVVFMNPHFQINGTVAILDLREFSPRKMVHVLHPSTRNSAAKIFQECYPAKTKMLIAVHCSAIVTNGYKAVRYLFKKKIQNRMKFLGSDMTELHQYVNPAVLPKDYGGSLEETEFNTADFIMNNLPYLKYERSFGQKSTSNLRSIVQLDNTC